MPILKVQNRPVVIFDATNEQHRSWAFESIKNRTWGRCPVKFEVYDDSENVSEYISRKLVEYYLSKEFAGQ